MLAIYSWWKKRYILWAGPVLLRLECTSESSIQITFLTQKVADVTLDSAFLSCFPMVSLLLAYGPHSQQQGAGGHPAHPQVSLESKAEAELEAGVGGGEEARPLVQDEVREEQAKISQRGL